MYNIEDPTAYLVLGILGGLFLFIVVMMEKFHSGLPEVGSLSYCQDEPPALRFTFSLSFSLIFFIYSLVQLLNILIFTLWGLINISISFIVDIFTQEGKDVFPVNNSAFYAISDVFQTQTFGGLGLFEPLGFALAGYMVGIYLEEVNWKVYLQSFFVYMIYSLNTIATILHYIEIGGSLDITTYIIMGMYLPIILIFTWIGNNKSSGLKGENLLSVKFNIRLLLVFTNLVGVMVVAIPRYNLYAVGLLQKGSWVEFFLGLYLVFVYYSMFSLIQGDVSRIPSKFTGDVVDLDDLDDYEEPRTRYLSISTLIVFVAIVISVYLN